MKTYRRKYTITIGDFIVINSNIPVIKKEEPENIVLTLNTALDLKNYLDKHFFGDFNYCYKENRKGELTKIDKVLNQKLDALSKTEADNKAKAAEIEQKEKNLKWLESIQSQVNNIINF